MRRLILGLLLFGFVTATWADCQYQGKWYPTGTRMNGKVCQPDGSWR